MAIPIRAEPLHMQSEIAERCTFCATPTRYWHERTNNPVCVECAPKHRVGELTDWTAWAKVGRSNQSAR